MKCITPGIIRNIFRKAHQEQLLEYTKKINNTSRSDISLMLVSAQDKSGSLGIGFIGPIDIGSGTLNFPIYKNKEK